MSQVKMVIDSVRRGMLKEEWTIILKEEKGQRSLLIFVAKPQADLVGRELLHMVRRQLPSFDLELRQRASYDLQLDDIEAKLGIKLISSNLESVTINRVENNVFSAKLLLAYHDEFYEVDYFPAKALAFALRLRAPIFADERILDKTSIVMD